MKQNLSSRLTFALLGTLLCYGSCKQRPPHQKEAEGLSTETFIGPWVASAVDVAILSKNGSGGNDDIHFDSKELAAGQGRKPTLTLFAADGSYREENFNLRDSLISSQKGFWHFYSDSLFMRLEVDGSPKIAFKTELEGKGLRLLSKIDWDGDGAKDDAMVVALKRP